MNEEQLSEILITLRTGLSELLDDRFEDLYLYGSQARGDAQSDSDIDVLVVLQGDFDYFEMIERTSYLTAELSLENDTVISCVFVTKKDYQQRRTPLLINIRREGNLV